MLLCIYGSLDCILPVPLLLWIPRSYPIEHPLVFIDLESLGSSKLAVGPYVNPNGIVSLPLFSSWRPDSNNILHVIQEAASICRYDCFVQQADSQFQNKALPYCPTSGAVYPPELPTKPPKPSKEIIESRKDNLDSDSKSVGFPPRLPVRDSEYNNLSPSPPVPPKPPRVNSTLAIDLLDSEISNHEDSYHRKALSRLQSDINRLTDNDLQYIQDDIQSRKAAIEDAIKQFGKMYQYEAFKLEDISKTIKTTKCSLKAEISVVEKKSIDLDYYEKNQGSSPDPSSLMAAENVVVNQLYELVAKDCAISDTIHALSRLLSSDSIKLELFAKKTRELAREQFLTRMHIHKVSRALKTHTS